MLDGETTAAARARAKRTKRAQAGLGRAPRPATARTETEPAFARREVVVHGMRITLPALRFMETAPPSSRLR